MFIFIKVIDSQKDAKRDGVRVPTSVEEYCVKTMSSSMQGGGESSLDMDDFFEDEMDCDEDDEVDTE